MAAWGMVPRTRLAFATVYLAATEAVVLLLQWVLKSTNSPRAAAALGGWTVFLGWAVSILLLVLALRWLRDNVMWSVRNRLIVTYLFIGGVPVTLAVAIALLSGYLVLGDLAVFSAVSEIKAEANRLGAANAAAEEEITRHSSTPEKIATADKAFPGRSIAVLPTSALPGWVKDGFAGLVSEKGHIYLRAANSHRESHGSAMVVSSVLLDQKFLGRIANKVGSLTLYSLDPALNGDEKSLENALANAQSGTGTATSGRISAGTVSDPVMALDREFDFGGPIQVANWVNGSSQTRILLVTTRLSTVYSYLTASMGIGSTSIVIALIGLAITFAIVVLIALLIGVGLTRKITYSVANLYRATQYINRGDFSHRIDVRSKDQLAALQVSFNSMTDNLEKLIAEQKEKERLQSELEIAHEVQAQLFPRANVGTSTLELHGICRPARIVSGDYYDFLSYGPEQVMVAVGDVSGKGISAALLMATIHSAVRAYEQEQLISVSTSAAYGTTTGRIAAVEARVAPPSPAQMLWLLNRHLFQSTQPEKYATLFLGFYDDQKHRLTYSNAGHLPPIVLAGNGAVRRLGTGGTVVGLFPDCDYEEETIELYPGDIFIAFSDGITEPENEFGEFGEDRLIETAAAHRHQPLERITEHVISAVQDWIGSTEQPDDITLVLARRI